MKENTINSAEMMLSRDQLARLLTQGYMYQYEDADFSEYYHMMIEQLARYHSADEKRLGKEWDSLLVKEVWGIGE